ncbi:MAG: MazF family transcriptional regulator [Pseudonocardiaceae bacterium]
MSDSPRRGDIWTTDAGITVLVISSTVYNEIPSEPTVVVVPVFDTVFDSGPDNGFGVDLDDGWTAPGLVTSLRKARLAQRRHRIDVQALTDVNTMLFKILATPDR